MKQFKKKKLFYFLVENNDPTISDMASIFPKFS